MLEKNPKEKQTKQLTFHRYRIRANQLPTTKTMQQSAPEDTDFVGTLLRNQNKPYIKESVQSLIRLQKKHILGVDEEAEQSTQKPRDATTKNLLLHMKDIESAVDHYDIDLMHLYVLGCLITYAPFREYCLAKSAPHLPHFLNWLEGRFKDVLGLSKPGGSPAAAAAASNDNTKYPSYQHFLWDARRLYFERVGALYVPHPVPLSYPNTS